MLEEKKRPRYFEEALSDFTHDAASGGAIRHMVDLGYTVPKIMEHLDYPTPRARVEQTVYKYLLKKGTITDELGISEEEFHTIAMKRDDINLYAALRQKCEANGIEHSFVLCPFGMMYKEKEVRLKKMLSSLTSREQDYVMGIPWEMKRMYHQLDSRMLEISAQLFQHSEADIRFYFLQSRECIIRLENKKTGVL